ncbi:MAG: histone deacetylase, partial [Myxococcota bacterium]
MDNQLERREVLRIGFRPWLPTFQERTLLLAGGSIQALEDVMAGARAAGNLGGGTHHAFAAHGEGYCVFNDLAIVARLAQRDYGVGQIVIADLDVHQGNGTADILRDDPEIFTYSIHGAKNYPFRKQQSDLDVEVATNATDTEYLEHLDRTLPEVLERRRPELVLFQAGVDGLATDTLGKLSLTREGINNRNRRVFDWVSQIDAAMLV